jgi:hypothetical protein
MFQTALGIMHPGNSDGIDAQVLTRFTVALLLGKVERTNYLEYKVSLGIAGNLKNTKPKFCTAARRNRNCEYGW